MSMRRQTQTRSCVAMWSKKTLQRHDAPRAAQQAAVHADAHHLGRVVAGGVAFGVERVEAVAQVLEERVGVGKPWGSAKRMSLQSSV
jgi:hypothetical protein